MERPAPSDARAPGRDAGRTDDAATLRRRLATAGEAYLLGAADNPLLGDDELALVLRNRRCPPALLTRFATERAGRQEIKRLLVLHPRTPLTPARALVAHLFWRELAEVAAAAQVNPVVRRQAERLLATRLDELAVGERIALARRASRGLIRALCASDEARVLAALFDNPRTTETDATAIARDDGAPAEALAELARHPTWSARREVRLALARNPAAPVAAALRAARGLDEPDRRRLSGDDTVPRIVRVAIARESGSRSGTV